MLAVEGSATAAATATATAATESAGDNSGTFSTAAIVDDFFTAIHSNDTTQVRSLLAQHRLLLTSDHPAARRRNPALYRFPPALELEAYRKLGAYIGALLGLHAAILLGHSRVALDIIDATLFVDDLDATFGGGGGNVAEANTALHLAVLMDDTEAVKALLKRGAKRNTINSKGFKAIDLSDNQEITQLWVDTSAASLSSSSSSSQLQQGASSSSRRKSAAPSHVFTTISAGVNPLASTSDATGPSDAGTFRRARRARKSDMFFSVRKPNWSLPPGTDDGDDAPPPMPSPMPSGRSRPSVLGLFQQPSTS